MSYEIELVASENAIVGESPLWNVERQILYWTDIFGGRFWEFNPATGGNRQIHDGEFIAGIALDSAGGLTIGTLEGVKLWHSDEDWKWLFRGDVDGREIKLNDVIASPDGSLVGGSGHLESCTVFQFKPDGNAEIVDDGLGLCNGMGFSPDLSTFYSTDSLAREVYQWQYNRKSGTFSNKRLFATIDQTLGLPDGLTVDSEGFVWLAVWYGGTVVRFDPDGSEERRIDFPATQTSCPMFGGRDLNELYVTTAYTGTDSRKPVWREPEGYNFNAHRGGELYRVKLDIQGKPEFRTAFSALTS